MLAKTISVAIVATSLVLIFWSVVLQSLRQHPDDPTSVALRAPAPVPHPELHSLVLGALQDLETLSPSAVREADGQQLPERVARLRSAMSAHESEHAKGFRAAIQRHGDEIQAIRAQQQTQTTQTIIGVVLLLLKDVIVSLIDKLIVQPVSRRRRRRWDDLRR